MRTHSMQALFQLCCVYSLILDCIIKRALPRAVHVVGCAVLVSGVLAFTLIGDYNDGVLEWRYYKDPAFLWMNLSALTFAMYGCALETVLSDIPQELVIGAIGVCGSLWGWIPVLIAHAIRYEVLSMPSPMIFWFVVANGSRAFVTEYCVMLSVRKTTTFVFSATVSLSSPIALMMMYFKNMAEGTPQSIWSWWYIPSVMLIVGGCCLVYYEKEKEDKASERRDTIDGTVVIPNEL